MLAPSAGPLPLGNRAGRSRAARLSRPRPRANRRRRSRQLAKGAGRWQSRAGVRRARRGGGRCQPVVAERGSDVGAAVRGKVRGRCGGRQEPGGVADADVPHLVLDRPVAVPVPFHGGGRGGRCGRADHPSATFAADPDVLGSMAREVAAAPGRPPDGRTGRCARPSAPGSGSSVASGGAVPTKTPALAACSAGWFALTIGRCARPGPSTMPRYHRCPYRRPRNGALLLDPTCNCPGQQGVAAEAKDLGLKSYRKAIPRGRSPHYAYKEERRRETGAILKRNRRKVEGSEP